MITYLSYHSLKCCDLLCSIPLQNDLVILFGLNYLCYGVNGLSILWSIESNLLHIRWAYHK